MRGVSLKSRLRARDFALKVACVEVRRSHDENPRSGLFVECASGWRMTDAGDGPTSVHARRTPTSISAERWTDACTALQSNTGGYVDSMPARDEDDWVGTPPEGR